jgi:Ca2+-transporting ATPase
MWVGFWMSFLTVGVGFVFWSHHIPQWQTMLFTSLAFMQMAHVMAIRSERDSLFRQGLTSNPWLLGAVASTLGLQLAVVYIPFLQKVFGTEPLGLFQLGGACALGGVVFGSVEVEKYLLRKRLNSPRSIQKTHR